MIKQPREWVVDLLITRHGTTAWEEIPEDWYCPSTRYYIPGQRGMYPRTLYGVIRRVKQLQANASGWGMMVYLNDLTDCRLRNIRTNEVILWAVMGT